MLLLNSNKDTDNVDLFDNSSNSNNKSVESVSTVDLGVLVMALGQVRQVEGGGTGSIVFCSPPFVMDWVLTGIDKVVSVKTNDCTTLKVEKNVIS